MEINKTSKIKNQKHRPKTKNSLLFGLCFCFLLFDLWSPTVWPHDWEKIDKGFYYTQVDQAHLFQIDLERFRLSVATAPEFGQPVASVQEFAQKSKAILAINGGFFSPEQKSIGLLMRSGKKLNPLHLTPWWAVFYVLEQKAVIVPPQKVPGTFLQNNERVCNPLDAVDTPAEESVCPKKYQAPFVEMALQVGPRLVINGKLAPLKPSLARRSGIGILSEGKVIIAIADTVELSIQEFAKLFQQLGCENALNLDGGGSSQLYIHWKGFHLDLPGPSLITNAITVYPRE